MNKKIVLLIGIIFLIGSVIFLNVNTTASSEKITNIDGKQKIYNYDTKIVTIKNSKNAKIVDVQLLENTEHCVECYARGKTTLYSPGKLIDTLKFEGGIINGYKIYIQDGTKSSIVNDYNVECEGKTSDNTKKCWNNIVGNHIEQEPIWKKYYNEDLSPGVYYWKIEGIKSPYARIDWIGSWGGNIEVREWALWGEINDNVAYFDFNEGSGGYTVNRVHISNNASIFGSASWNPSGIIGSGGSTPGTDGSYWKSSGVLTGYNFTSTNFSVSFWVKFNTLSSGIGNRIIGKWGIGLDSSDWMITKRSSNDKLAFYTSYYTADEGVDSSLVPVINKWYHVVATKNKTGIAIWVNGTLTGYLETNNIINFGTVTMTFGDTPEESYPSNIIIDEVSLWNRSLTESEITSLYNSGAGISYGGVIAFSEISQTYNSQTVAGSYETFVIDVSYDSSHFTGIISSLIYNGTSYSGTKSGTGNNAVFTAHATSPNVPTGNNATFYWNFALTNSSGVSYFNSTFHNQTITSFTIQNCSSGGIPIVNYTLYDEEKQTKINGTIEISMEIYSSDNSLNLVNYTNKFTETNNASVCIPSSLSNSSVYRLYTQTRYYSSGYASEYHYFQNFSMQNTSIPQLINLYDLDSSNSTEFIFTYKGASLIPIKNALIILSRKYVSEGVYKTVEIAKTDDYGRAKLHINTDNVDYSILVSKEGQVLSIFDNVAIYCQNKLTGECNIELDQTSSFVDIDSLKSFLNFVYSFVVFDTTTRTSSLNYQTSDGSSAVVSLNLTEFDNYQNVTICSSMTEGSSGTLSCYVPNSYTNITFIVSVYKDGSLVHSELYSILPDLATIFGDNRVIWGILMVLSLPLMFIPDMILVIIGGIIGLISAMLFLGLSKSWIGVTSSIIWIIIAFGIIIWKMNKGGRV